MKTRRVTMDLEIETDVAGAQLRKRAWWNAWLAAAPVTVLQAGVNVIRIDGSMRSGKKKPAKKKGKGAK